MDGMAEDAAARRWRRWTVLLPSALAFVACVLMFLADLLAQVMANWDSPMPGLGWLKIAAAGHGLLAVAAVVLFGFGLRRTSGHRGEAITAWLIIAAGLVLFAVCVYLVRTSA